MTCRNPNNCQKKPDPRSKLCRPCALSVYCSQPHVVKERIGRLIKANRLDWLPAEHRQAYESMRDGSWSAAEAKAEVLSWGRKTA